MIVKAVPMTFRFTVPFMMFVAFALPMRAESADPAAVVAALKMPEMIAVMQDEGVAYGADLEEQLFPGAGGVRWAALVDVIYDEDRMARRFDSVFTERLGRDDATLQAILAFFGSNRGQRIVALEIEARRALLDKAVEDAAKVTFENMAVEGTPRLDVLHRFAEANDLIEQNVSGALNANLAFYRGLAEGGAFADVEMTEADILADVWAQEPDVRTETEDWLYPFLNLAYEPLSDADMLAYLEFSRTPAAAALNSAMFAAFDDVFGVISHDLGRAAAEILSGQDI